ncbi:DUF4440 domain-containing protein [Qipengyuania sp. DGS5-3]|uniref:DUF4440 domain-containing protein n=1 Tax=Qipengyuania sp. DGS5-3 TaxID=3349632 RepID=UPI0036D2DE61
MLLALALAQTASTVSATPPEPAPIPQLEEATKQVIAQDAELFWAAFEGCNARAVEDLLTDDFRMIHDLSGLVADNRDSFVASIAQQCAAREPGGANPGYKNRRLSVPGSRTVTPLGQWGVLERGMHTFHELRQRPAGHYGVDDPGGPSWVQVGGARYIHIWQWMANEGQFRLAESISVDHGAAAIYPPSNARE